MLRRTVITADRFREYVGRCPGEAAVAKQFIAFLESDPAVFERSHLAGHFTGSAWLVSADGERVLLTHHRKLGRWLQLGGHADGDADLAQVALREAEEEPNYRDLSEYCPVIATLRGKGFSYREIAEWLSERGVELDHNAVYRLYTRNMPDHEAKLEDQEADLEAQLEGQRNR